MPDESGGAGAGGAEVSKFPTGEADGTDPQGGRRGGRRGDPVRRVRLLAKVAAGANVRPVGKDVTVGAVVLRRGDEVTPAAVGVLATLGIASVAVTAPPTVGVLSTGDELEPSSGDTHATAPPNTSAST